MKTGKAMTQKNAKQVLNAVYGKDVSRETIKQVLNALYGANVSRETFLDKHQKT